MRRRSVQVVFLTLALLFLTPGLCRAEWTLKNPVIVGEGFNRQIIMETVKTWIFYIGKIDHFFLLVPAFYLLYRGLKVLDQQARIEKL